MNKKLIYSIVSLSILSSTLIADEGVKQSINLGFSNTSGNTDTLNFNGKYIMDAVTSGYAGNDLKIAFDTSAFLTENDDIKNNEEYTANLGLEQNIMNGWLGYTSMNWLKNKFRNFDAKAAFGAGVGKELLNDGKQSLKVKLGAAYNLENFANGSDNTRFGTINEYLEYNNKLNKTSNLYLKAGVAERYNDMNDYEAIGAIGVNFVVAENISVTLEEEVSYDKAPSLCFDKTDTKTIVRVGYNF